MPVLLANNAVSTLQADIDDAATTITINAVDADAFPNPGEEQYFYLTVEDRRVVPNAREIMTCNARSDGTLTVSRGEDGTSPLAFSLGAIVSARLCRGALGDFVDGAYDYAANAVADEAVIRGNNDTSEAEVRAAADAAIITDQQAYTNAAVAAEASARASVDAALQAQRENDITYINTQVAAEAAARASVDSALQAQRNSDIAYIDSRDATLQANINSEAATRLAADVAEAAARLATTYIRLGVFTTNGAGAFAVSFSPPYGSQLVYWSHGVLVAGGVIGGFDSMVMNTSGVSGRALDSGGVPLPGASYGWFSVGY